MGSALISSTTGTNNTQNNLTALDKLQRSGVSLENISEVKTDTDAIKRHQDTLVELKHALSILAYDKPALLQYVEQTQQALLAHALATCSFYQERYGHDLSTAWNNLKPLRKKDLQTEALGLWSDLYANEPVHHWMTSGSTGEPTKFIIDEFSALSRDVSFWLSQRLAGTQNIEAQAKPEQSLMLRLSSGEGIGGWYKKMTVYNNALLWKLSVFKHPRCDIQQVLDWVRHEQPLLLGGDPQAFLSFIEFWQTHFPEEQTYPFTVNNLTCGGNQLSDEARQQIEAFFGTPVTNCYGLSEVSIVASECTHGKLHVHAPINWVDIVDDEGKVLPDGESGNVVVTNLINWSFPFIRYQTGDLGSLDTPSACPCGCVFPILNSFSGRKRRMFKRPNNELFSPNAIVGLLITLGLAQYQVIQETPTRYLFRYVLNGHPFNEPEQQQVIDELQKCVEVPIEVTFERCESLVEPGIKFQDFISHCHDNPV